MAMAIMMGKLYAALIAANVPEEKARLAAEESAEHETRFAKIESDLIALKIMNGLLMAGVASLVLKAFFH